MTTESPRWPRQLFAALCIGSVFTVCGWLVACSAYTSRAPTHVGNLALPVELRDDYLSFASNCSKCHQLSRALGAQVESTEHWDLYVARMMRNAGSAISPLEEPKILRFLHWYTNAKQARKSPPPSDGNPPAEPATTASPAPEVTPPPLVAPPVEASSVAEPQAEPQESQEPSAPAAESP